MSMKRPECNIHEASNITKFDCLLKVPLVVETRKSFVSVTRVHLARTRACKVPLRPPALDAFTVCATDVWREVEQELVTTVLRMPVSMEFGYVETHA